MDNQHPSVPPSQEPEQPPSSYAPPQRQHAVEIEPLDYQDHDNRVIGRPLEDLPQPKIKGQRGFLREAIETVLLVIAIYTLVNLSTARFVVEGSSMEPNFFTDEFVIVSRLAYITGEPERGDVVVFHYDEAGTRDFIKRVIGLPGEHVESIDGRLYVNGQLLNEPYIDDFCNCRDKEWWLGEDEYFVLGDNRNSSQDSHDFGPIDREQIIGRAWIRYWPPEAWDFIPHHDYQLPENLPLDELPPAENTDDNNNRRDDLPELDFDASPGPGSF